MAEIKWGDANQETVKCRRCHRQTEPGQAIYQYRSSAADEDGVFEVWHCLDCIAEEKRKAREAREEATRTGAFLVQFYGCAAKVGKVTAIDAGPHQHSPFMRVEFDGRIYQLSAVEIKPEPEGDA